MAKGEYPAYKGDGVAVWLKKDKNGKTFLSMTILGSVHLNAFKYEPKKQEKEDLSVEGL